MSAPSLTRGDVRPRLGRDFHRLWAAYSISEVGSALASGALPLVAVLVLQASTLQVTFLAALSGIASAAIALPLGSLIEFRAKRPTMIVADLTRFAALGSVPLAAAFGSLSYAQLCAVGVVQTTGNIVFNAASGAHLKALVPAGQHLEANSRLETTSWTATSAGPPVGGLIISWLGATATLAIDAASYLLSAVGVCTIQSPEPQPPAMADDHHWLRDRTTGWRHIFAHPGLSALFWNSVIFGGCIMMAAPLMTIFMLRDLGLEPWQYGLALGIPGLGGIAGSLCTRRLAKRFGDRSVLLTFGVLRTLWLGLIPLAPPGPTGLIVIVVADFLLLFSAGVFNPTFITYRMRATADTHMSRVVTAWSISSKSFQPLFIIAGGLLAAATSARFALVIAAAVLLTSALFLPWRARPEYSPGAG